MLKLEQVLTLQKELSNRDEERKRYKSETDKRYKEVLNTKPLYKIKEEEEEARM